MRAHKRDVDKGVLRETWKFQASMLGLTTDASGRTPGRWSATRPARPLHAAGWYFGRRRALGGGASLRASGGVRAQRTPCYAAWPHPGAVTVEATECAIAVLRTGAGCTRCGASTTARTGRRTRRLGGTTGSRGTCALNGHTGDLNAQAPHTGVGVGMSGFSRIRLVLVGQAGITSLSRPNTIARFAITTPSARR